VRIAYGVLAAAFLMASAAPAAAAKGGSLTAGGQTSAGPGAVTVAAGGTQEVFSSSSAAATDSCVTVANTGRVPIFAEVTGVTTNLMSVGPGDTLAACVEDLTGVEMQCAQEQPCSAQWRVDRN
jgi:hypothetical protein